MSVAAKRPAQISSWASRAPNSSPPTPVDGKAFANGKALLIGGFYRRSERRQPVGRKNRQAGGKPQHARKDDDKRGRHRKNATADLKKKIAVLQGQDWWRAA